MWTLAPREGGGSENQPPSPHKTPLPLPSGLGLCVLRHRKPVPAEPGLQVCMSHLTGLGDMLREAVSLFGELDELAVPGPSTEEHVRGRPVASKPPMRLDVLVVRDTRLVAVEDDMVPVGVLTRWAMRVGMGRRLQALPARDGVASLERLRVHLRWVCEQEWVLGFDRDLRAFTACLRRLAGDVPRPRVGVCGAPDPEDESRECGGTLLADKYGQLGVSCVRCGDRWTEDELRRLGMILAAGAS